MSEHTPGALIDLLKFMAGKEPAKMPTAEAALFREAMLIRFGQATAFIAEISRNVMRDAADNFLSAVTPGNSFSTELVGFYGLQHTGRLDRFIGESELVQLFAAISKPIEVKLDLIAEARHPGYAHSPHVELSIECTDDPELELLEEGVKAMGPRLQKLCDQAVGVEVMSYEGAQVRIENPPDIVAAVKSAAEAVRRAARENEDGHVETMGIKIRLDATTPPETINDVIWVGVVLLHTIAKATG